MTESKRSSLFPGGINPFKDNITGTVLLGRYRVVRRLAAGGMGVVYLARAEGAAGFAKPVVLKLVLPNFAGDKDFAGMFIREAKILASLQHPGIVGVIDFAQEDDCYVMVLEYVNGFSLGQWTKYRNKNSRRTPASVLVKIMIDVLEALHYAHSMRRNDGASLNIIHRDISPGNIMIDIGGRIRVVDFGIAVAQEDPDVYKTQNESTFKGKLQYAAPEQFAGVSASVQSDVYACGVVLHECLLGYNDFTGQGYGATLGRVMTHQPTPVSPHRSDVAPQFDAVLRKALEKDPQKRYPNAQEFAADLRKVNLLTEQEASVLLQELVYDDFNDEMANLLSLESLHKREKAWRDPSQIPPPFSSHTTRLKPGGQGALSSEEAAFEDRPAKTGGFRDVLLAASVFMVVVAAIAIAIAWTRSLPQAEPKILIVQSPIGDSHPGSDKSPPGEQGQPEKAEAEALQETTASPEDKAGVAGRENTDKTRAGSEPSEVAKLTQAFRKEESKIRGCFEKHALELEGTPEISFRFEIAPDGRVQSAHLLPASLASTTLGKCLRAVASGTQFPKLGKTAAFSIPVRARRGI